MDQDARTPMDDDARLAARREEARIDAALVDRVRDGDPDAFGMLYERWFERVHDLAFRITRDSSVAPEVAQDAFVSAWRTLGGLQDTAVFGGWLLRITRNAALNRRRKELRSSPRDVEGMAVIEAVETSRPDSPAGFRVEDRVGRASDPACAVEDGEIVDLVWDAAEALGERDAEVLDLTLRHGLTPAEIGEVIGVNRNAANQTVHRVRGRLKAAVEARVLWRGGSPVCGDLADALAAESINHFGADAVRVASAHAESCAQCGKRREMKLEPSAMFAATPFLAVPFLKQQIAHAMSADGIPMGAAASGGDGVPPNDLSGEAREEASTRRRWRGRALAAIGVVVIAIAALGFLAEEIDEADTPERPAPTTSTSTSTPAATVPVLPVTPPGPVTKPTTRPRAVTPPLPPPAPAVAGTISISPSGSSGSTFVPPVLSWSVTNAATVQVSGPGFASAATSGSASVCPGTPSGSVCVASTPGPKTYTVRGFDAGGNVVFESSTTFTVG